ALSELGRIDVVVNNAGGSMPRPFLQTSERFFNEAFHWNVSTAFNLTQLAVPHLLKSGGGSVVNIASVAGRFRDRGFSGYGTAKAALVALPQNLAADLAPRVRVNAIAPGAIETSALGTVLTDPAIQRRMVELTPLGRLGAVEDIAAAAVYLASEASSYVTGVVVDVAGGVRRSNFDMGIPHLEGAGEADDPPAPGRRGARARRPRAGLGAHRAPRQGRLLPRAQRRLVPGGAPGRRRAAACELRDRAAADRNGLRGRGGGRAAHLSGP